VGENTIYIEFSIDEASKKHVDDSIDRMGQRADAATGGMGAKLTKEFEQSGKSVKDYEKLITGLQKVVSNPVEMGMMKDADITLMRGKLDQFDQALQKTYGSMDQATKAQFNNLSRDAETIISDLFTTNKMSSSFARGFQQNVAKMAQTTAMEARKMSADLSAGIVVSPEAMTNMRTKLAEVNDMMFEQITNARKAGVQIGDDLKRPFNELTSATNEFGRTVDRVLVKYSKNVTENKLNQAKTMLTGLRTGETYSDKELKAMVSDLKAVDSQFTNMHKSGTKLNTAQQEQWRTSRQVIKEFAGEMRNIERQQSFMNSGFAKFSIIMSGLAATIFVMQNVVAAIRGFIAPLAELESSLVVTQRRMNVFGEQAIKLKNILTEPGALGYGGPAKIAKEFEDLVVAGWKADEALAMIQNNIIQRNIELEGTTRDSLDKLSEWWNNLLIDAADVLMPMIEATERLGKQSDRYLRFMIAQRTELKRLKALYDEKWEARIIGVNDDELKKELARIKSEIIEVEVLLKVKRDDPIIPKYLKRLDDANAKPDNAAAGKQTEADAFLGVARKNYETNKQKFKAFEKDLSFSQPLYKTVADFDKMLAEIYMVAEERGEHWVTDLATKVHNAWKLKNVRVPLWKDLEEQTGYSTKEYSAYKKEQAKASYEWYLDFLDKEFADILVAEEKFVSRQKKLAPLMDIWNQVYKRKGIKPDAMIANEIKVAQHAIDKVVASKLLTPEEGKAEKAAVSDEIKYQQQMDHLKRIEDVFKQTGIMTQEHYNLQKLKDDKYMHDYGNEMTTVIEQVTQAKLTAARDMNWIKGPLEDEANVYSMLGIATEEYIRLLERKRNIQNEVDKANPSTAPYAEELDAEREWLDEQAVLKAKMDAYSTLYSSTKHMSQEYYDNEIKIAQHAADEIIRLTGEIGLANEHMARRQLELDAMRLHSSDDYMEGMKIALREVEMEHKSAAERTAEFWRDAHQAMGDSFTDLFYDVLMWEMDSLEDYARAFISSIAQSMANQFGDMASNGLSSLINMGVSALGGMFGGGSAITTTGGGAMYGGMYPVNMPHTGGIVGSATLGDGAKAYVDPSIFFNAPRFHSGLKPDEFPAILQRGEEVVPRDKVGAKQDGDKVKIINVLDPSVVGNYLSTTAGERLIVNYMQRNKRVLT